MKLIRGVVGLLIGGLTGASLGGALTLFNNLVWVPTGAAAYGPYSFWVAFFGIPGAALGLIIGALTVRRTP